ncbi:MAG: hypothetical protein OXE86_20310 [Alphaproteobacteria bacterium]|nr:hypothetical protein [Alphaproteobacteria bacterium]
MERPDSRTGRIMRLPLFDGQVPSGGPVHLVSDQGDELLLVAVGTDTPGRVEDLAAASADRFEAWLGRDVTVRGTVLGTVIWYAAVTPAE